VLESIEDGKYAPELQRDIVEPALTTAIEQMESVRKDVDQSVSAKRKIQYDPVLAIEQLHVKSAPIATAYPQAAGASEFEAKYREILDSVRSKVPP
jgi:hypothetical protein